MRRVVLVAVVACLAAWPAAQSARVTPAALRGWPLYERFCLACHGVAGDGHGPAAPYAWGRPRDLTTGEFSWRTTPAGQPPTDDDLRTTITYGAPGTSMHGFGPQLSRADLDSLVAVVRAFAPLAAPAALLPLGPAPPIDTRRGAEAWGRRGCKACHAEDGTGKPSMVSRTYDLTREPLHRPRASNDPGELRRAAALSIATGRSAMPAYGGIASDADIWALADHVVELQRTARPPTVGVLDDKTIELDRTAKVATATWPGDDPDEGALFGAATVPPQGPPPASLAPAQASLSARQCARCHAKQYREWETSLHRAAASPGLAAQMMGMPAAEARACLRCHAPLAEQVDDDALRAQSLSCAGCHVRNWTRHGPPDVAPSLMSLPGYPLETLSLYERGDFCMPCHQLPPRTAVEGKPLLDTYKEWLDGPYMKRGIQCQHCHMPNREHTFLGVHDQHTFKQGIALSGAAHVKDGEVTVRVELANVGAGHALPTNPTPAVWLWIELVDAAGRGIPGASSSLRIGRDIYYDGTRWHERADTRILPGDKLVMARAWAGGRVAAAASARVTVEVHPDDYYERLYAERLTTKLSPERRALYEQALERGKKAHYTAEQKLYPIAR